MHASHIIGLFRVLLVNVFVVSRVIILKYAIYILHHNDATREAKIARIGRTELLYRGIVMCNLNLIPSPVISTLASCICSSMTTSIQKLT